VDVFDVFDVCVCVSVEKNDGKKMKKRGRRRNRVFIKKSKKRLVST
jgi:hypothetical protein